MTTNEKSRLRMQAYRQTLEYQAWLVASRELRKALKCKYRRKAGAMPQAQISARAKEKERHAVERKMRREEFKLLFVGPQRPTRTSIGEACFYRWRYQNDENFRAKEIERTKRKKKSVPLYYANHLLGGNSERRYPVAVLQAKQLQHTIKHYLKDSHENN